MPDGSPAATFASAIRSRFCPSGRSSFVERIVTFDGDLDQAVAGQSVTLTLADEIDCSRGDIIAAADEASEPVGRIDASLVWMSDEALVPHRSYWLKVGTQTISASVDVVRLDLDVNTLETLGGIALALNDIGQVVIDLDRAVPGVRYAGQSQARRLHPDRQDRPTPPSPPGSSRASLRTP